MRLAPGEVPAVAALAVRDLVLGPPRPARVLARFPSAAYLQVPAAPPGRDVLALLARDALALPLGLALAGPALPAVPAVPVVGGGVVQLDGVRVRAVRERDHRVVGAGPPPAALPRDATDVPEVRSLPAPVLRGADRLAAALADGDAPGLRAAVRGLVGLGPGLTPAGDDVLCGALVALRAVRPGAADALAAAVAPLLGRTGALSGALLAAAGDGHALPQVAAVVAAVGDAGAAGRALLAVGSTSGAALLLGVRTGLAPVPARARRLGEEAA